MHLVNPNKMIIGLSGHIGSGKDLVAKMIQDLTSVPSGHVKFVEGKMEPIPGISSWSNRKFAAKLKQMVSILTGIPVADLEKPEVKNSELGEEWSCFISLAEVVAKGTGRRPLTVRELLQRLGTDAVRDKVHQNAWVNALFADYNFEGCKGNGEACDTPNGNCNSERCYPNWIISDMRFPNEMEAVKACSGITVRIERDYALRGAESDPKKLHPSETALDSAKFDYVINNDAGIPELLEQVKQMLITFKII